MAVTRLGQYGGPKTDFTGSAPSDLLDNNVSILSNSFTITAKSTAGCGVNTSAPTIAGNNTFTGTRVTAIRGTLTLGTSNIQSVNNALYYTAAGSIHADCEDLGGNYAVKSAGYALLPNYSRSDFTPSRYAEACEPVAQNPQTVFPGEVVWYTDSTGYPVQDGDWCCGSISQRFFDVEVPISIGLNTELVQSQGITASITADGICTFSSEPETQYFGRGCVVSYTASRLNSSGEVEHFSARALVNRRCSSCGRKWTLVSMEGGLPSSTSVIYNGSVADYPSSVTIRHFAADLTTTMSSNNLARYLGFRTTTGSLISSKINLDISLYNCTLHSSLTVSTLVETSEEYRVKLRAPRDYRSECIQTQACDHRRSMTYGAGFVTSTRITGAMVKIPTTAYMTFESLRFQNKSLTPAEIAGGMSQDNASAILAPDGSAVHVNLVGCTFIDTGYVTKIASGHCINNVIHRSFYGIEVRGDGVILAHNTIVNPVQSGIRYHSAGGEYKYFALNNVVMSPSSVACIISSANSFGLGNACTDGSGTNANGSAGAVLDATGWQNYFINNSGDYTPQPRGLFWNRKAVIDLHRIRPAGDDSRHGITATLSYTDSDHDLPTTLPDWFMPSYDDIAQLISSDFYGRQRKQFNSYCGAIEFKATDIHVSISGMVDDSWSGSIEAVPMASPLKNDTWRPAGLFRIKKSGYINLNALRVGLCINAKVGSSIVQYQLAERVSDTIWRMTTPTYQNFTQPTQPCIIKTVHGNVWGLGALNTAPGDSNGITVHFGLPTDLVSTNLDVGIHYYDANDRKSVDNIISIRDIISTHCNPLRICSNCDDIGYHGGVSAVDKNGWEASINGTLSFVCVNGAKVEGLALTTSRGGTAVVFNNCLEPEFSRNFVTGGGDGVRYEGYTVRAINENNVFIGSRRAITESCTSEHGTGVYAEQPMGKYASFTVGPLGGEAEFRVSTTTPHVTATQLDVMKRNTVLRVVLSTGLVTPTLSLPIYSSMYDCYVVTATMAPGHTWYDLYNTLSDNNPFGIEGYYGPAIGPVFFVAMKPVGQQVVTASAYPTVAQTYFSGEVVKRNWCRMESPYLTDPHLEYTTDPIYSHIGLISPRQSNVIVCHNTFVRCRTAIDSPSFTIDNDWLAAAHGRVHVINNLFDSCLHDATVKTGLLIHDVPDREYSIMVDDRELQTQKMFWVGNATTQSKTVQARARTPIYSRGQRSSSTLLRSNGVGLVHNANLKVRGFGISGEVNDLGCRLFQLYQGGLHISPGTSDFNTDWGIVGAVLQFGRLEHLTDIDVAGYPREYDVSVPGAFSGSATIAELETEMVDSVTDNVDVSSTFSGYQIYYHLTHDADGKNFYTDPGVFDAVLSDGMILRMRNIALISEHITFAAFIKTANVYVDACLLPYTTGQESSDSDLENRVSIDAPALRYVHDQDGAWFDHHLQMMTTYKPAFCGTFMLGSINPLVAGFSLIVETNPAQLNLGPGIIYGRGLNDSYSPALLEDLQIHSNEHGTRWVLEDGTKLTGNTADGYMAMSAFAIQVMSPNHHNLIVRNIRLAQLDNWPFNTSGTTLLSMLPYLIVTTGARSVQIYNSEIMYHHALMFCDFGFPFTSNLEDLSIVGNTVMQLDYGYQKAGIDALNADLEITTPSGASTMAMFPNWNTSEYGSPATRSWIPLMNRNGNFVNLTICNNDVMAYNAGVATDSTEQTKFEFVQGLQSSDPGAAWYSPAGTVRPNTLQSGNRMVHPWNSLGNSQPFIFGPSVAGTRFDSSNGTTRTRVTSDEVFGDGLSGNTTDPVTGKRYNIIEVDTYLNGECIDGDGNSINFATSQKYESISAKPTMASSAFKTGTYPDSYRDVDSTPVTDIVGSPRLHSGDIIDIGSFYVSASRSVFGRDQIIGLTQVFLESTSSTADTYRIGGSNAVFNPQIASMKSDYSVGAKMLVRLYRETGGFAPMSDKPKEIVAVFPDTLYDPNIPALMLPMSGYADTALSRPLPGSFIDRLFEGITAGRYLLGYDYTNARAVFYKNPTFGLGCTGYNSVTDQVRYSENRMVVS